MTYENKLILEGILNQGDFERKSSELEISMVSLLRQGFLAELNFCTVTDEIAYILLYVD